MKGMLLGGKGSRTLSTKDAVNKTASSQAAVSVEAYLQFWANLTNPTATDLVHDIGKKMLELEASEKKKASSSNSSAGNVAAPTCLPSGASSSSLAATKREYGLFTLAHTLDFVHLFYTVNAEQNSFQMARKQWDNVVQNQNTRLRHSAMERYSKVMSNVITRYQKEGEALLNFAMLDCSYVQEEANDDTSADFPFVFTYLRHFTRLNKEGSAGKELYEIFEKNFLGILKASKKQPSKFTGTLMNLLHMLCELLVMWPPTVYLEPVLARIADVLKHDLMYWPLPYAEYALHVAKLIRMEIGNPGSSCRERLIRERPDLCGHAVPSSPVLLVVDVFNNHARTVGDMCKLCAIIQRREDVETFRTISQRDVLLNVLKLGLRYAQDVSEELHACVSQASEEDVARWLHEVLVDEVEQEQEQERHAKQNQQSPSQQEVGKVGKGDQDYYAMYQKRYEVLGQMEPIAFQAAVPPEALKNARSSANITDWIEVPCCRFSIVDLHAEVEVSERVDDLAHASKGRLPRHGSSNSTTTGVNTVDFGVPLEDVDRVVVVGGNEALHKVLCSYISATNRETDENNNLKKKKKKKKEFFLVPAGRNDICSFLALHDGWYRKHVYSPFVSTLKLCPPVESFAVKHEDQLPIDVLHPLRATYDLISDYVQSAKNTVELQVFECLCWKDEDCSDSVTPSKVIPFLTGVELGLNAAVSRFLTDGSVDVSRSERSSSAGSLSSSSTATSSSFFFLGSSKDKSVSANTQWHDAILDRAFIKSEIGPGFTPEVRVSTLGISLDGQPLSKTKELTPSEYILFNISNARSYQEATCDNPRIIPQPFQSNYKSTLPTQDWLEVNYIPVKSSTGYMQELLKKKDKKMRDLEALTESIRTEQVQHFGKTVDITATKRQPFLITVDQHNYGPFFRVKIRPSAKIFPVKSFVPVAAP